MCSCVAEASCESESSGTSVSSVPKLPGQSEGSAELSEPQKGSGLEDLPETAGRQRFSCLCVFIALGLTLLSCVCNPSCFQFSMNCSALLVHFCTNCEHDLWQTVLSGIQAARFGSRVRVFLFVSLSAPLQDDKRSILSNQPLLFATPC